MDIAVMIEGQQGLTWPRWQRLVEAAESLGFAGLYRSDHFTDPSPPDQDSLELWVSLTWAASHSRRLAIGPLVAPVSFRDPIMLARTAMQVDDLSGGRLELGLGAGWNEREHTMFGYPLLSVDERFARFEEALQIVSALLRGTEPVSFAGRYYQLQEARLLPTPSRPHGPPIVIGGNGPLRTLPLVARYADQWNAVYIGGEQFAERCQRLDALLLEAGRAPSSVKRTLMTGLIFAPDAAELADKLAGRPIAGLRERGLIVGTPDDIRQQTAQLAGFGVERLMVQWIALDDLAGLEQLARAVL